MTTTSAAPGSPVPDYRETAYVMGYFALVTIAFSWPVIMSGASFYAFDILNQFLPWAAANNTPANNLLISDPLAHLLTSNQLLHEGLNSGHIPYWNPWLFAGVPFEPATNPVQIALLYFLDPVLAHDTNLILHLFAAGFFFYWWARQRGLATHAAVFGGTAWMFNGYLMVWFEWEFAIMIAAMLPLVLVAVERCFRHAGINQVGFLALSIALLISTGFYQLTVYCALFVFAFTIFDHFARWQKNWRDLATTFVPLGVATLLAIVITLPYFVPKVEAMLEGGEVQRLKFTYAQLITIVSQLDMAHLLLLIFPNLFSNPAGPAVLPFPGGLDYMYNNFNELCLYAGVPVLLIATCTWAFRKDKEVVFFALVAGLILLMLAGTYLYYPIYLFPGLDYTTPNRLLFVFGFCICALATVLFHQLFSGNGHERVITITVVVALVVISLLSVALLSGILLPLIYPLLNTAELSQVHVLLLANPEVITTPFIITLLTAGLVVLAASNPGTRRFTAPLLILVLAADLVYFGSGYNTKVPPADTDTGLAPAPMIRFLQDQPGIFRTATYHSYFLHNYLQPFHLEDTGGYLSVFPRSYAEFIRLSQPLDGVMPAGYRRWLDLEHLGHPLLSMAGMKYFVAPAGAALGHPDFTNVYSGEVSIFENSKAFERAYFVCNADYMDNPSALFTALANADIETLRNTVMITGSGTPMRSSECESAISVTPGPNGSLNISLAAEQEGLLVIANQYHQHWKLESPGHNWPILRANHTFMTSIQPPGVRQLQLSYQPDWHRRSYEWAIVAWLMILVLLGGRAAYRLTR